MNNKFNENLRFILGGKWNIIHIGDGAIDDTVSSFVLNNYLNKCEFADLKACIITDADCIGEAAMENYHKIINHLGLYNFPPVYLSESKVVNQFPHEWRCESKQISEIPCLKDEIVVRIEEKCSVSGNKELKNLLEKLPMWSVIILATGPLTPLYDVLKSNRSLKNKLFAIFFMGGAFNVTGNLDNSDLPENIKKKYSGSEWNVFSDPPAFKWCLENLRFINWNIFPLDLTNKSFITDSLMKKLGEKRNNSKFNNLICELYELQLSNYYSNLWDIIATIGLIQTLGLLKKPVVEIPKGRRIISLDNNFKTIFSRIGTPARIFKNFI